LAQLKSAATTNARALCDIGPKYAGTSGEAVAREFLLGALRKLGYTPIAEEFEYLHYMPRDALLEVCSPVREPIRAEPLQFAAVAEGEGEMVYVGDGSRAQIERIEACGVSLKDKIAVTSGWPPFMLYPLAEKRGAAGYVIITRPPDNLIAVGCGVLTGHPGSIPGVMIGNVDGHRLLSLMSAGKVVLHLKSHGEMSRRGSENIIAEIVGRERPSERVVVCSHYDSQTKGAHAWDNVSGDVALLAFAEAAADLVPERTLTFFLCGVEEQGICSGSRAFVDRRSSDMKNYAAVVNLDGLSAVLCPRNVIQATAGAFDLLERAARRVGWRVHASMTLDPNSDHAAFVEHGVPAIWAHEGPRSPYQHTEGDVFEHLDMTKLLNTAAVGAGCALDLACDISTMLPRPERAPWQ
jgi:hypothetical protein